MKVYFNLSLDGFSNCYIVGNEETHQALIIDPGKISHEIINIMEQNAYSLEAVLITHNHKSHCSGIHTLRKIYEPKIFAADYEIAGADTHLIKGDGIVTLAGMNVCYLSVPGHTADSMVYKIGNILFSGDTITAGLLGGTNNTYADQTLLSGVLAKILSQNASTTIMPGHGPPSCVEAEKKFNLSLGCPLITSLNKKKSL